MLHFLIKLFLFFSSQFSFYQTIVIIYWFWTLLQYFSVSSLLTSQGVHSLFIFLRTLNTFLLVTRIKNALRLVIDNNVSYFFWYLYLAFLSYFLLISLQNWTINKIHCKHSIRVEKISKSYSLKEYTIVLFAILSKIVPFESFR